MRGMSKAERAAMPPDVKSAVEMVRIWIAFVVDILDVRGIDFDGVLVSDQIVANALWQYFNSLMSRGCTFVFM